MLKKSFSEKVYAIVKQIPQGKVLTYQDVAIMGGSPRAARAVGTAMKNNPDLKTIPCHRVVGSDGKMHGYSAKQGIITKVQRLKKEGVYFIGERVELATSRWKKRR
jgi:methylated-DNA-[protein]-cysteine S-methyltransferase